MKGFAIGCGTLVALALLGFGYLFLTVDFSPTPAEIAACDDAVDAAGGGSAVRDEAGYAIEESNGRRTVQLVYALRTDVAFVCTVLDGEAQGIERREQVAPGRPGEELEI